MSSRCLPLFLVAAMAVFMGLVVMLGLLLRPELWERRTTVRSRSIERPGFTPQLSPSGAVVPDASSSSDGGQLLTYRTPLTNGSAALEVNLDERRFLTRLTLRNLGAETISWLSIAEPDRDWSSPQAILDTIIRTRKPKDDRERALCIFDYVHDNLDREAFRSEWDCFEVWKAFNCYGMGPCEVHARTLAALWEFAGLASVKANVAALQGENHLDHSMVEVFYDKGWRLFDSHGSNFFLSADNRSIIGWREIDDDPSLISRSRPMGDSFLDFDQNLWMDPSVYEWEFDRKISRIGVWKGELPPRWDVRPGDRVIFERDGGSTFVDNIGVPASPRKPFSRAVFHSDLPSETTGWDNLDHRKRFRESAEGPLRLRRGASGTIRREVRTPFPIVSATVTLDLSMEGKGGRTTLRMAPLGPPDREFRTVASHTESGDWSPHLPLDRFWDDWNEPYVRYGYALVLDATAPIDGAVVVRSIRLSTACQTATRALPDLANGPWILSASPGDIGGIEMEVQSLPYPADLAPPTDLRVREIESGDEHWLEFGWSPVHPSLEPDRSWEVDLSDDSDFRWTMLPYLTYRHDPRASKFRVPTDLFPKGVDFYYRVRQVDSKGLTSQWSEVLEFTPRPL